jgi:hypothetical protein
MLQDIIRKYAVYCHWKESGMLSGKFGNKDAQRRLNEIRTHLKELGLTLKDLEKIVDKKNFREYIY